MALYVLTRHAHSTLNAERRVNGDPAVPVVITAEGRIEAERAGHQLSALALELCVHTRFQRTRETAEAMLAGREVPRLEEPLLDDVDVGELEGASIEEYRTWKRGHRRDEPFPGGESLNDASRRYADAYERILRRDEETVLCICHEIPVRYAINMASGSEQFDAPLQDVRNATPYVFDAAGLQRAVERLRRCSR